jgi:hypothetical protein
VGVLREAVPGWQFCWAEAAYGNFWLRHAVAVFLGAGGYDSCVSDRLWTCLFV